MRAVVFTDPAGQLLRDARFHDFAVIWDGDHDDRVIEPIEKIYLAGLLPYFSMFGERKGSFFAMAMSDEPPEDLENHLSEITQRLSDPWSSNVQTMEDPGNILTEPFEQAYLYLSNIMMLWRLGIKLAKYQEILDGRQLLR